MATVASKKGNKMPNQTQSQKRTTIAIGHESLRAIGNELKRLRTELLEIRDWDKWEFQQNEIRQNEGAQYAIIARIQKLESEDQK
jgi:hypothetical protein